MHFRGRSFSWRRKRTDEVIDKRPEILAPCGNPVAFRAALSAGADAMYLAMDRFGARAYAGNFQQDELLQAIEEAHLHDRKVYLTLNTLLKNEEFAELPDAMDPLYRAGLDAVLVQDFGVYRFLRERYPELPLHASTQMNLCSVSGARYAKSLGFTRVVPARELSLTELREIREQAKIEVEAFVHGAMCVCYSGRCYLSSFAGGRSGNRGRCAQPCREMYSGRYPLSMKDLCTLEDVPQLMEAGVDSLKIEGRMKNEYYVAACVDAYRTMVDDVLRNAFSPERAAKYRQRLTEVFHRGGFTRGYLNRYTGPDMLEETTPGHTGVEIGRVRKAGDGALQIRLEKELNRGDSLEIRLPEAGTRRSAAKGRTPEKPEEAAVIRLTSPVDAPQGSSVSLRSPKTGALQAGAAVLRVRNAKLMTELEQRFLTNQPPVPVCLRVKATCGSPLEFTASLKGTEVTKRGPMVEPATGKPLTNDTLRDKIGTLSGTGFSPDSLVIQNDGAGFVPLSRIKDLRRDLLNELREELLRPWRRELSKTSGSSAGISPKVSSKGITPEATEKGTELNPTEARRSSNGKSEHGSMGQIFFVSTTEQAEQVMTSNPLAVVFDLGLRSMETGPIRSFYEKYKGKTRFLVGYPYIYRTGLSLPMEELLRLSEEMDGAYINGIDSLAWLIEHIGTGRGKTLFLGEALYRYNDRAVEHFCDTVGRIWEELWLEEPYELSMQERESIHVPKEMLRVTTVYGHRPMMLTMQRHGRPDPELLDGNRGQRLILLQNPEMCYNILLSGRPVLQDAGTGLRAAKLTVEKPADILRLLQGEKVTEGLRHRGLL